MLFNSFEYFLFFPAVVLLFFILPFKWRNAMLLVASYYFYMQWKWQFGFLMLFTSVVNYVAGLKIANTDNLFSKKIWLTVALVISFGILVYYKYANFFISSFIDTASMFGFSVRGSYLNVILPVGISFFTFQALSYTLDVYFKKMKVESNLLQFLLFVSFFPQLVAGPIERASNLLDQFKEKHYFNSRSVLLGGKMIIWGLFKKVVIADRLASYTDSIYSNPELYGGSTLLLATFFFTFQIYCDFSGYSDIAIGSARIMGFRLMQNFNLPYIASSISDFWKRWHISLSTWFGDYVYKPLGGNRVGLSRWIFNIFFVFLVSGLWHGANWTFVIWGGMHGTYYLIEYLFRRASIAIGINDILVKSSLWKILKIGITFVIVMIAWVFFRADNVQDAWLVIERIFTDFSTPLYLGSSAFETMLGLLLILFLFAVQILQSFGIVSIYFSPSRVPAVLRWATMAIFLLLIGLLGVSSAQFIYFQF